MTPPPDTRSSNRRRTFLKLVGATATAGALQGTLGSSTADSDRSVVLEQGDRCVELTPLAGEKPVEELYDYTYPKDRYEGPPGSKGGSYSSEGTTDLQRDRTSVLFLYDGPQGLSLVVVHGHLDGEDDAGGTATFTFEGLPEESTWIVRDDYYLENGEQADSNWDRWDVDGDIQTVDWAYVGGRTDGGAVRGLGSEFEVVIDPAFNEDATLAGDHDFGPIEAWEALAGDRDAPDRLPLRLDRPVTIRTGTCGEATDDETTTDDEWERRKRRVKHQKEQFKQDLKEEKKQLRQQLKHRLKSVKHQKYGDR